MNNLDFDQLRDRWPVEIPSDPNFQRQVWTRIASANRFSLSAFLDEWLDRLSAPRISIPLAASALAVTVLLATHDGRRTEQAIWNHLAQTYGTAIDPTSRVHLEHVE